MHYLAHLVANNLCEAQLSAHIHHVLELPPSDVAHTYVVNLPTEDQVMECPQCLFHRCATVPAMCLEHGSMREEGVGDEGGGYGG